MHLAKQFPVFLRMNQALQTGMPHFQRTGAGFLGAMVWKLFLGKEEAMIYLICFHIIILRENIAAKSDMITGIP